MNFYYIVFPVFGIVISLQFCLLFLYGFIEDQQDVAQKMIETIAQTSQSFRRDSTRVALMSRPKR